MERVTIMDQASQSLGSHLSEKVRSGRVLMSPSILSADFLSLRQDVTKVTSDEKPADFIHVDVMDGHFTPNLTIGPAFVSSLKRDFATPLDVHLMVSNPEQSVDWYLDAGADLVCAHLEALTHANRFVSHVHDHGALVGIAINPATPISMLTELVGIVDLVLIMSVNPGFGGQSFIQATLRRLKQLRELCLELEASPLIEVDGGINKKTAPLVAAAGANVLVAGSAVFGTDDPAAAMNAIRTEAEGALL